MSVEHNEIINGYFVLDLNDDEPEGVAAFKTCSGLSYETEIVISEQNFADGRRSYKKRPGRIQYGDIEFERGLSVGSGLLEKHLEMAERGQPVRSDMAIHLYNDNLDDRQIVASWTLQDAWISGWSLAELDAEADDVLIQTLRITHSGLKRNSA